jgi:transposase
MDAPTASIIAAAMAWIGVAITGVFSLLVIQHRGMIETQLAIQKAEFDRMMAAQQKAYTEEIEALKARLVDRAGYAAEAVAERLLRHPEWRSRTFKEIGFRIGGFPDDELRKILVRAGAIRVQELGQEEAWGLLALNEAALGEARD